jgi:PAS domain S-box-containing protein
MLDPSIFRDVIESSYNGIIAVDADGLVVVFNRAAKRILNVEDREFRGRALVKVIPDIWPEFCEILGKGIPQIGVRHSVNDSNVLENRTALIRDHKVAGVVSVFQEVSELERISKELAIFKQVNKELDTIIESSYDGISITDGHGTLSRVNSSWERITGLNASEVIGKNMAELERQGYISEATTLLALKYCRQVTKPSRVARSNTEILVTSTPIFDASHKIVMVVTNVRDLTDLNNLNKQLEESKRIAGEYYSKLEQFRMAQGITDEIVAASKQMGDIVDLALRVAEVDSPVLIQGETGVGKEVIARLLHNKNPLRKKGQFVVINCGAIPENLLESELFGYEKGAFTGASDSGKEGQFEVAEGGTLLLDEIEALPLNLQVKLLNTVQDLKITRIGGTKSKKIDARIIAASNQDLYKMVQKNNFREDLFYRLNVVPIHIPPLRERKDDILPLVHFFLQKHNAKYRKNKHISRPVIDCLTEYHWEGNIRELSNVIEQFVVISRNEEILLEDLPAKIRSFKSKDFARYPLSNDSSLKQAVRRFEFDLINEAISKYGSIRKAADFLKVDRTTITRKMKKHNSL